jgi:uncharacterized protein
MPVQTVVAVAGRIAEHARSHHLSSVTVVLHGGEPLLLGQRGLAETLTELRRGIEPAARLDLRMQSNGVLLSESICDLLVTHDVRVGISLDGDRLANDRHRRFLNGSSSYEQVLDALALLRQPRYRRQYAGILCTIDVRNDPIQVYETLVEQSPPRVDLLLPHATWDHPPLRPGGALTPYAQWLLRIYDRWMADGEPMPIRLFDSLRSTAAGGPSGSEWVGLSPADLVVIETDGAWEQVDSLKTAFDGAPATGMSVFTHSVDQVAAFPEIARRQRGMDDLCEQCRACPVVRQCGGGLFAHRYREGSGFANPSAYCADLLELIVSMNARPGASGSPVASPVRAVQGEAVQVQASPGEAVLVQASPGEAVLVQASPGEAVQSASLPAGLIEQIGSGRADPAAMSYLAEAQLSIGRALAVAVAERGSATAQAGLELLGRLDEQAPHAVRAVLSHPYLRVWAVEALRRSELGGEDASGYLGCVAAAAAIRAGAAATIEVPVTGGVLHLPTVGTMTLPGLAAGSAELTISDASITLRRGGDEVSIDVDGALAPHGGDGAVPADQPGWQPARWIAGEEITILLEDLDPYRDCHDWKADGRLAAGDVLQWWRSLTGAWRVVQRDAPSQVESMRIGLRAIAPLSADSGGLLRSSTARHAFGSVGVALAADDALAVMLVHEFQHTVLGALLDLSELFDPAYRQHLRVAWRTDLRPIEGVLQGTFAHLAVADIWRIRAERAGADECAGTNSADGLASTTYRQYRDWTAAAIDVMVESGALTPDGSRFVASMAETMTSWT